MRDDSIGGRGGQSWGDRKRRKQREYDSDRREDGATVSEER